jgi:predicted nucleic acid-binding protein
MWLPDAVTNRTIYLDANVFIYAFESTLPPFGPLSPLRDVFHLIQQEKTWARTSQITRAEVLVHPLRQGNKPLVALYSDLLSGTAMIGIDAVSSAVVDRAAHLRASHNLRLADALHLATAIESGCDAMITADKRLAACNALMKMLLIETLSAL